MSGTCHYCGATDRELRPYGPGGSDTCFPCMKASPDRQRAASRAAAARLGAFLDELDEQTRRPGEKPLRQAVAEQARERLREIDAAAAGSAARTTHTEGETR